MALQALISFWALRALPARAAHVKRWPNWLEAHMPLTRVRFHEVSELEPRVLESLGSIEEGLTALDNQLGIGEPGRPDILAVDSFGTLVIIELKSDIAGVPALDQAVRYFEWASINLALLAKPFPRIRHDRQPRILIIAPEFDEGIRRLVRYLEIEASLIAATCVRDSSANYTGVLFESLEIPRGLARPPLLRSVGDIVSYITDETVRKEFTRVLDTMREAGSLIEPYAGGKDLWLCGTFGGEVVAAVQTRHKWFNWELYDDDGNDILPPLKLDSYDEWAQKAQPDFLKWLAGAKSKA